ncbi:hypothetical protein [Gordonia malaquae]|uniref:hypothetical protein n=1 Tax=Gordonia malaquae TaxID=410332 RepID=UPI00301911F3
MSAFYDPRAVVAAIREVAVPVVPGGTVDVYLDFLGGGDRIAVFGLSKASYAEQSSDFVTLNHHDGAAAARFHIDPAKTWAKQVKAVVAWLAPVPS